MHRLYVTCMEALYFGAHACIDGEGHQRTLWTWPQIPRGGRDGGHQRLPPATTLGERAEAS